MGGVSEPDVQKARIRRIAAELFARKGYHNTGVAELALATGLARGALYHHIRSKEDVLYAISRGAIDRILTAAQELREFSEAEPESMMRLLSAQLIEDIATHRSEWTVFFRELRSMTLPHQRDVFRAREAYEQIWSDVLAEGAHAGVFTAVDAVAVKALLGLFNYSYLWIDLEGDLEPQAVAQHLATTALEGLLKPRAEAPRPRPSA